MHGVNLFYTYLGQLNCLFHSLKKFVYECRLRKTDRAHSKADDNSHLLFINHQRLMQAEIELFMTFLVLSFTSFYCSNPRRRCVCLCVCAKSVVLSSMFAPLGLLPTPGVHTPTLLLILLAHLCGGKGSNILWTMIRKDIEIRAVLRWPLTVHLRRG